MALSDADLERACQLAAAAVAAPSPGPRLLSRLRAILSGCALAHGRQQQAPDSADRSRQPAPPAGISRTLVERRGDRGADRAACHPAGAAGAAREISGP